MATQGSLLAGAFGAEFHSMRVPGVQVKVQTNQGPVGPSGKPIVTDPAFFYRVFDDSFDITFG